MGYYTDYTLTTSRDDGIDFEELGETLDDVTGYMWNSDGTMDNAKWYSHAGDMHTISKIYPTVLFQLDGEGEESGDVWRSYYLNGKVHDAKVVTTIEAFDEAKLK